MASSGIHAILRAVTRTFSALGIVVPPLEIERIAVTVSTSMNSAARRFHTVDHVLGFLKDGDPLVTLAAIFHDLVYLTVDKEVHRNLEGLFSQWVHIDFPVVRVRSTRKDERFESLLRLFGLRDGQRLELGQNEFLSALAFLELVGRRIDAKDFFAVATCIEASIPFRPQTDSADPFTDLEQRLVGLSTDVAEAQAMVARAVRFANLDVGDFGSDDPAHFLNNTWKLLPEINPSLLLQGSFAIGDYRRALVGMEGFFKSLEPTRVFHRYGAEPSPGRHKANLDKCEYNLAVATRYLGAKILAAGLLEATALATGGDAPLVLFMGDFAAGEGRADRLEKHLPDPPGSPPLDDPVHLLLAVGRLTDSSFDIKNSPLGLFVYRSLKPRDFDRLLAAAKAFFAEELTPTAFLAAWHPDLLTPVLTASAAMVPTRRKAIRALAETLDPADAGR